MPVLQPGHYTRYIIWRRGYKDTDGSIQPVGMVYDSRYADVYAVVDDVIVTQYVPTGINNILQEKTSVAAWVQNGTLHVSGLIAGKSWSVYDVSGKLVSQSIANSETADIPLFESGVYLVSSGNNTVKVINK